MNPLFVFIFAIALLPNLSIGSRICRVNILRSFGYKSRITAVPFNPLCPRINYNCCSQKDIMRMHKIWNNHAEGAILGNHQKSLQAFAKMSKIIQSSPLVPFMDIVQSFRNFVQPPNRFLDHLTRVTSELVNNSKRFNDAHIALQAGDGLPKLYEGVQNLRKAALCSTCSWGNNRFIDTDGRVVTFRSSFCRTLIQRYIDTLNSKYNIVFRFFLLWNEFSLLVTGKRLFPRRLSMQYLRYANLIQRCRNGANNIQNCGDICREFNLNRYSHMWDGEPEFIENTITEIEKFSSTLRTTPPGDRRILFAFRQAEWAGQNLNFFLNSTSALSSATPATPPIGQKPIGNFDFRINAPGVKRYVGFGFGAYTGQLDLLEDAMNSTSLYRLHDAPVDISLFIINYDDRRGIDLFRDMREMRYNLTVDKLLALLHTGKEDDESLDEIVDERVKEAVGDVDLGDVRSFAIDADMFFKIIAFKKKPDNSTNTTSSLFFWRKLNSVTIFDLSLGILGVVLFWM